MIHAGSTRTPKQLLALDEVDTAQLVIIRGLPGSGKSTLAKEISKLGFVHFETDFWFEQEGHYLHNVEDLSQAHEWCLRAVFDTVMSGSKVVVSNVSHLAAHVQRFVGMADRVVVIELTSNHGSVHDIPGEILEAMKLAWEPFEGAIRM